MSAYDEILRRDFWSHVEKTDTCWLWTGYGEIYGVVHLGSTSLGAHRLSYEWAYGEIPEGHHVHHKCSVARCVRPDHLEAILPEDHWGKHWRDRTHCRRGHPYTPENTRIRASGKRVCRTCHRLYAARNRARARAHG